MIWKDKAYEDWVITPLKSVTKTPVDLSRARTLLQVNIIGLHYLTVSHVKYSINYRCLYVYSSVTERYIVFVDWEVYDSILSLCGLELQPEQLACFPSQLWKMRLETQDTSSRVLLPVHELLLLRNKLSSILHQVKLLLRAAECSSMKLLLILYRKS